MIYYIALRLGRMQRKSYIRTYFSCNKFSTSRYWFFCCLLIPPALYKMFSSRRMEQVPSNPERQHFIIVLYAYMKSLSPQRESLC